MRRLHCPVLDIVWQPLSWALETGKNSRLYTEKLVDGSFVVYIFSRYTIVSLVEISINIRSIQIEQCNETFLDHREQMKLL